MVKPIPRRAKRWMKREERVRRAWGRLEAKGFLACYPTFYISGIWGHVMAFNHFGNEGKYSEKELRIVKQGQRLLRMFGHE
jgi:hypothetical protein